MTRALDDKDYCYRTYWPARARIAAAVAQTSANLPENPDGK